MRLFCVRLFGFRDLTNAMKADMSLGGPVRGRLYSGIGVKVNTTWGFILKRTSAVVASISQFTCLFLFGKERFILLLDMEIRDIIL